MKIRSLTRDAAKVVRGKFKPSTAAERQFYSSLRKVAELSGHIIDSHVENDMITIHHPREMQAELERYAKRLEPWARRQAKKLTDAVSRSNAYAYKQNSKAMATAIKLNVAELQVGVIARALMAEQVGLIKSIPTEAGARAQKIAFEAALYGTRAAPDDDTVNELKKQLGLSTEVARSRAQLISVTETARANSVINQARAQAVGARGYIWRTTMDGAERYSHAKMNGKYVEYDKPPTLIDGTTGHAGTFPRCRCYGEPVFDDE